MSGGVPGPGWWLASDGRWYPPELQPAIRPAPLAAPPVAAPPSGAPGPRAAGPSSPAPRPPAYTPPARPRRRWWPWLVVGVLLAAAVGLGVGLLVAPSPGPSMTALHVVSQPTPVGHVVVVVDVTRAHTLQLSGVDPTDGAIVWQMPYSTSETTPGVAPYVPATGGVVVDLDPTQGSANPAVVLVGVEASSGTVLWRLPSPVVLTDYPTTCGGTGTFCAVVQSGSNNVLIGVSATSGAVQGTIEGIARTIDGFGLYQTASSTPTFEHVRADGASVAGSWTTPVSAFFGPGYTPDSGWDFDVRARLDVGTVGVAVQGFDEATDQLAPGGATEDVGASRSVGFTTADGTLVWRAPGAYQCGGSLGFLSAPVLCQFTGVVHITSLTAPESFAGVTLDLAGLRPATGAVTWTRPVDDVTSLADGTDIPFPDGRHLVVRGPDGLEVVDVADGSVAPPRAGPSAYWCEHLVQYRVAGPEGQLGGGQHTSAPTFGGCSASGVPGPGHPADQPSTVGVTVSGVFVWLSPRGLETAPAA